MGMLQIALLGRPQVSCDGVPLTGWAFRKSLALLAYLAVTRRTRTIAARWPVCFGRLTPRTPPTRTSARSWPSCTAGRPLT